MFCNFCWNCMLDIYKNDASRCMPFSHFNGMLERVCFILLLFFLIRWWKLKRTLENLMGLLLKRYVMCGWLCVPITGYSKTKPDNSRLLSTLCWKLLYYLLRLEHQGITFVLKIGLTSTSMKESVVNPKPDQLLTN